MSDLFNEKNIIPMAPTLSEPFDSDDYIFEIKFDGMRCIGYYDNSTMFRNRTNKDITGLFPELSDIYRQFKKKCILDSELAILNNGKPDYSYLNKRRFIENKMRIEQLSKKIPATLIVYDILYYEDRSVMDMPLLDRKRLLEKNSIESNSLAVSRFVKGSGIELFRKVVSQELEGTVAKKNDGIYIQGRSRLWLKSKRKQDVDLLLCGYMKEKGFLFCNDELEYKIAINSINRQTYDYLLNYVEENKVNICPLKTVPDKIRGSAVWTKPELYCVIEYMQEMESGFLREAVFKGIKLD